MLIGYTRVSKADGSQSLDLQRDALIAAGVAAVAIYEDEASGKRDSRPGLDACLKALRAGDTLIVWKLDRLGRDLRHLVNVVQELADREVAFRVLAGQGAQIDTTTAAGRLVFGIFAALAEFERELIRERTVAGLAAARARGRRGGRKFALSKAQVRLAQAAMKSRDTSVSDSGCRARHQARHFVPVRRTDRGAARERQARAWCAIGSRNRRKPSAPARRNPTVHRAQSERLWHRRPDRHGDSRWLQESCPAGAAATGEIDMRIEIAKDASVYAEVVIRDEDQSFALRMTLGPDGIERLVHERGRSAIELSSEIAAALRALSSALEHILSTGARE